MAKDAIHDSVKQALIEHRQMKLIIVDIVEEKIIKWLTK